MVSRERRSGDEDARVLYRDASTLCELCANFTLFFVHVTFCVLPNLSSLEQATTNSTIL